MEDVKLYVERVGVDPASGADIRIARRESTSWHKDIVAELINQVLRCGAALIIVAVLTACDDRQVSYFPGLCRHTRAVRYLDLATCVLSIVRQ